jgi:cholesterol oxidase
MPSVATLLAVLAIGVALIPTAISVNPSLTISALAERVAFRMIHTREMEPGDSSTPVNH